MRDFYILVDQYFTEAVPTGRKDASAFSQGNAVNLNVLDFQFQSSGAPDRDPGPFPACNRQCRFSLHFDQAFDEDPQEKPLQGKDVQGKRKLAIANYGGRFRNQNALRALTNVRALVAALSADFHGLESSNGLVDDDRSFDVKCGLQQFCTETFDINRGIFLQPEGVGASLTSWQIDQRPERLPAAQSSSRFRRKGSLSHDTPDSNEDLFLVSSKESIFCAVNSSNVVVRTQIRGEISVELLVKAATKNENVSIANDARRGQWNQALEETLAEGGVNLQGHSWQSELGFVWKACTTNRRTGGGSGESEAAQSHVRQRRLWLEDKVLLVNNGATSTGVSNKTSTRKNRETQTKNEPSNEDEEFRLIFTTAAAAAKNGSSSSITNVKSGVQVGARPLLITVRKVAKYCASSSLASSTFSAPFDSLASGPPIQRSPSCAGDGDSMMPFKLSTNVTASESHKVTLEISLAPSLPAATATNCILFVPLDLSRILSFQCTVTPTRIEPRQGLYFDVPKIDSLLIFAIHIKPLFPLTRTVGRTEASDVRAGRLRAGRIQLTFSLPALRALDLREIDLRPHEVPHEHGLPKPSTIPKWHQESVTGVCEAAALYLPPV